MIFKVPLNGQGSSPINVQSSQVKVLPKKANNEWFLRIVKHWFKYWSKSSHNWQKISENCEGHGLRKLAWPVCTTTNFQTQPPMQPTRVMHYAHAPPKTTIQCYESFFAIKDEVETTFLKRNTGQDTIVYVAKTNELKSCQGGLWDRYWLHERQGDKKILCLCFFFFKGEIIHI